MPTRMTDETGKVEPALGEHMMDQISVQWAVSVLERVDVDDADDEAPQPHQFSAIYRPAAGFIDHLTPALDLRAAGMQRCFQANLPALQRSIAAFRR